MFVGFGQPRTKDGLQLFPAVRIAQVFGLQPGQFEIYGRQITASVGQIAGEVAQNVDQLQSFAKAYGEGEEFGIIQIGVRETMPTGEACPEFPDTAGDVIGVVVQILGGLQGTQFAAVAEPFEIQLLAARDGLQRELDLPTIEGGRLLEQRDDLGAVHQESTFAVVLLFAHEMGKVRHGCALAAHAVAVLPQLEHPFIRRDQLGVGDSVGSAGEQIKEADRLAHLARQYPQGQVKRP